MLGRHLRDLYWVSIDTKSNQFPDWRLSKLKFQVEKFSPPKIKQIISELGDIDILVKSSKTDLLTALDLLIVKQLE
jgi:DNA polymerase III delta subunit